jgi:hypothetical protein
MLTGSSVYSRPGRQDPKVMMRQYTYTTQLCRAESTNVETRRHGLRRLRCAVERSQRQQGTQGVMATYREPTKQSSEQRDTVCPTEIIRGPQPPTLVRSRRRSTPQQRRRRDTTPPCRRIGLGSFPSGNDHAWIEKNRNQGCGWRDGLVGRYPPRNCAGRAEHQTPCLSAPGPSMTFHGWWPDADVQTPDLRPVALGMGN